jgi:hypothetical protein
MAKQDVLDAINSTIVQNDIKAITAQSLNNVLTMMVENAGEGGGSGDGALRILAPFGELYDLFMEDFNGEFSPSTVAEFKSMIEEELSGSGMPSGYESFFNIFDVMFAHNSNVFLTIKEKAKNGDGCAVLIDQTLSSKSYYDLMFGSNPDMSNQIEEYIMSYVQVAHTAYMCMKYTPEIGIEEEMVGLFPIEGFVDDIFYPSNVGLMILPDGSIIFEYIEEDDINNKGVLTFYADNTGTITNDQKTHNANSYRKFKEDDTIYAVAIKRNNGSVNQPTFIANDDDIRCDWLSPMNGVLYMQSIRFASDGSFEWSSINAL